MKNSEWISSKKWDLFWVMGNCWLLPLAILSGVAGNNRLSDSIFLLGAFLSGIHFISPLFNTIRIFPNINSQSVRRSVLLRVGGILLAAGILAFFAGKGNKPALQILLTVYFIWNAWHFSTQHYGILSLYSKRAPQYSRHKLLDKIFCFIIVFILTPNVWFEIFKQNAPISPLVRNIIAVGLTAFVLIRAYKNKASFPILGYYLCVGVIPLAGSILSPVSHFLLYSVSHWIAEVGLSSRLQPQIRERSSNLFRYLLHGLGPLLLIGVFIFSSCKSGLWGLCGTTAIQRQGLENLGEFSFVLWGMLTLAFALPYLHFDLSRILYGRLLRPDEGPAI